MFVDLTYYNQAIPSPFGMPSFEEIDLSDPVSVSKMISKELLPNNVTPDFTGQTPVCSYVQAFILLSNESFQEKGCLLIQN